MSKDWSRFPGKRLVNFQTVSEQKSFHLLKEKIDHRGNPSLIAECWMVRLVGMLECCFDGATALRWVRDGGNITGLPIGQQVIHCALILLFFPLRTLAVMSIPHFYDFFGPLHCSAQNSFLDPIISKQCQLGYSSTNEVWCLNKSGFDRPTLWELIQQYNKDLNPCLEIIHIFYFCFCWPEEWWN